MITVNLTSIRKSGLALMVTAFLSQSALATPSWMGVYGDLQRHAGQNPGTFTVLMNQDYFGLNAEVGLQVDGGDWFTLPMYYVGNMNGNSVYQLSPDFAFAPGSTVVFYFHGFDDWGGNIWDSNGGSNYAFVADGTSPSEIQLMEIGTGVGGGCYGLCGWLDLDVRVADLGPDKQVGLVYTTDGSQWDYLPLQHLEDLGNDDERWGYHNNFSHRDYAMRFALRYEVNGQIFWDNHGNQDYFVGDVPPYWGREVAQLETETYWRTVGSAGSHAVGEAHLALDIAVREGGQDVTVGIVWTKDGWSSAEWGAATYDASLLDGFATYALDIAVGTGLKGPAVDTTFDVFYAVFYEVDGVTYWDNNDGQDYHVYIE